MGGVEGSTYGTTDGAEEDCIGVLCGGEGLVGERDAVSID